MVTNREFIAIYGILINPLSRLIFVSDEYSFLRYNTISERERVCVTGEFCVDCGGVARTNHSGVTVCGCSENVPGRATSLPSANWQNNPLQNSISELSCEFHLFLAFDFIISSFVRIIN